MKAHIILGVVLGAVLVGCDSKSTVTSSGSPPAKSSTAQPLPRVGDTPETPPPPPEPGLGNAPAANGNTQGAAPIRPVNEEGQPMSDLEFLNDALIKYGDPAARPNAGDIDASSAGGKLTDISDLVKSGIIKSIPQAPPGKKFVLDKKTNKIVLADAK